MPDITTAKTLLLITALFLGVAILMYQITNLK